MTCVSGYLTVQSVKAERHLVVIASYALSAVANFHTHAVYHSKGLLPYYPEPLRHEQAIQ